MLFYIPRIAGYKNGSPRKEVMHSWSWTKPVCEQQQTLQAVYKKKKRKFRHMYKEWMGGAPKGHVCFAQTAVLGIVVARTCCCYLLRFLTMICEQNKEAKRFLKQQWKDLRHLHGNTLLWFKPLK